jgi:hypothetical protein
MGEARIIALSVLRNLGPPLREMVSMLTHSVLCWQA